jgi:hypothetical protein
MDLKENGKFPDELRNDQLLTKASAPCCFIKAL